MTQPYQYESSSNHFEKMNFHESIDTINCDLREKSYEMTSEIYPRSNASDSFTTTGHSSRTSRKSELKSLKSERFMAKLCRSASNSPRIEYNSNSFLEHMKTKNLISGNPVIPTNNQKPQELHYRNPSRDLEELENQWQNMKTQHHFESRESTSPYKYQYGTESPSTSKVESTRGSAKSSYENTSGFIKKPTVFEKLQPMPNLLSKVIPQAKINLVIPSTRTQTRQGSNHSKSVEPKVSASPKGNQLHERNKNKDPFQIIAEKYSNINKKKQSSGNDIPTTKVLEKNSNITKSKEISRKHSPLARHNINIAAVSLENKPFIKSIPVNYIQAYATVISLSFFFLNFQERK